MGLNVESAIKRGIFTVDESLVKKQIGKLESIYAEMLEQSIKEWLNLT